MFGFIFYLFWYRDEKVWIEEFYEGIYLKNMIFGSYCEFWFNGN